jgi:hypothetical protein
MCRVRLEIESAELFKGCHTLVMPLAHIEGPKVSLGAPMVPRIKSALEPAFWVTKGLCQSTTKKNHHAKAAPETS